MLKIRELSMKVEVSSRMKLDTFGKRIRALRQDRGLSQIELRDRMKSEAEVEIGDTYISELERSARMPSLEIAAAMAKVLDVTLDYLGLLIEDGELSYKRTPPPVYFSEEADEVASLVDAMRPEQRLVIMSVARNLSALTMERAKRRAESNDILDSIEREHGPTVRKDVERILRDKGLLVNSA